MAKLGRPSVCLRLHSPPSPAGLPRRADYQKSGRLPQGARTRRRGGGEPRPERTRQHTPGGRTAATAAAHASPAGSGAQTGEAGTRSRRAKPVGAGAGGKPPLLSSRTSGPRPPQGASCLRLQSRAFLRIELVK